jgi:hypothetical protein
MTTRIEIDPIVLDMAADAGYVVISTMDPRANRSSSAQGSAKFGTCSVE